MSSEHREILEAVLKRNAELAVQLHTRHIEKTRDIIKAGGRLDRQSRESIVASTGAEAALETA